MTREKKTAHLKKSILEFIKFVLFHSRYVFDEGNELSFKMRTCTYAKKMFERLKVYDNSSSQCLVTWHMWQMWLPAIHSLRNTDLNWFVYSKKLLKRRWWNWHLDTILWKKFLSYDYINPKILDNVILQLIRLQHISLILTNTQKNLVIRIGFWN